MVEPTLTLHSHGSLVHPVSIPPSSSDTPACAKTRGEEKRMLIYMGLAIIGYTRGKKFSAKMKYK